jgi:hypothetical protein
MPRPTAEAFFSDARDRCGRAFHVRLGDCFSASEPDAATVLVKRARSQ